MRTPDGNFIIGLSTVNNNAQTIVFVYEANSASVLRSRTVTGQSTVLSVSPEGSRFMAGYTLYDTATLNVIGQYNAANVPFPLRQYDDARRRPVSTRLRTWAEAHSRPTGNSVQRLQRGARLHARQPAAGLDAADHQSAPPAGPAGDQGPGEHRRQDADHLQRRGRVGTFRIRPAPPAALEAVRLPDSDARDDDGLPGAPTTATADWPKRACESTTSARAS